MGKPRVLRLPTAHTGQYRDSPATPDVAGLPAASLLSPNQGHRPVLGLTDYYSPRLMVTQGRAGWASPVGEGTAGMEDPVKVISKGRADSLASWLLSVPTPVPSAGTQFLSSPQAKPIHPAFNLIPGVGWAGHSIQMVWRSRHMLASCSDFRTHIHLPKYR